MDQELFFNVSQNVLVCDVSLADEKAQAAYSARIRYSIHGTFRNDPPRGYGCPSLTVHQQVWARVFQGAIELWLPKGWGKKTVANGHGMHSASAAYLQCKRGIVPHR
jgi:hypothetical protein